MASVSIPIGTNTLREGTPRNAQKPEGGQRQCGELSAFIRQQAQDTTPSQPISTAVSVVQEFEAFCEQQFLVFTANKTSSSVMPQPIEIQHDCPLPTAYR